MLRCQKMRGQPGAVKCPNLTRKENTTSHSSMLQCPSVTGHVLASVITLQGHGANDNNSNSQHMWSVSFVSPLCVCSTSVISLNPLSPGGLGPVILSFYKEPEA